MRPEPITLIPDRFHRIAVSVSSLLLSVPISLSRCTDCRNYRNRIVPWVRLCVTRCRTSGRTVGIRLGWHGGVFVRTFLIVVGHVHSEASSKVAVFHWRNDILSAHLWHFPTLRLVPINLFTWPSFTGVLPVCSRSLGSAFFWCRRKWTSTEPSCISAHFRVV
jgi:hypothetical protein